MTQRDVGNPGVLGSARQKGGERRRWAREWEGGEGEGYGPEKWPAHCALVFQGEGLSGVEVVWKLNC